MEAWMIEELKREQAERDEAFRQPLYLPLYEELEAEEKVPVEDDGICIIQLL
jgi:hypothetical protein